MQDYQRQFIAFAVENKVLQFGDFTLKSGRQSPYFFNAGFFNSGYSLMKLGEFYADAIVASQLKFNFLFGPAYKGIPIVATSVISLSNKYSLDVPYAFNRKEVKDHGEGGELVGAPLSADASVLIVDDVVTAGTAIREAMTTLQRTGAAVSGVVIGLDRQERGNRGKSAMEEIESEYGFSIHSVVKLADVVEYLSLETDSEDILQSISQYQSNYGIVA